MPQSNREEKEGEGGCEMRLTIRFTFAFPALFDQAPEKARAMHTERWFEVGCLVKIMLEFSFQIMIFGTKEVTPHFTLGYHSISEKEARQVMRNRVLFSLTDQRRGP